MPSQHVHAPDARRIVMNHRLRRLKVMILGGTAVVTVGAWSLVAGAVAAVNTPATPQPVTPTVTVNRGDGFFGGGTSSLGTGVGQRPVARSRGS